MKKIKRSQEIAINDGFEPGPTKRGRIFSASSTQVKWKNRRKMEFKNKGNLFVSVIGGLNGFFVRNLEIFLIFLGFFDVYGFFFAIVFLQVSS